jgi:CubicO group peptidase (beta-lactamase class C family)
VGLLEPDGRTRVVAFGDPGPGQPPLDGNSVFEIGSISKVFTATVLAELVREGRVSLDDPAQKYLPDSVHLPTRNGKQITLGNLSSQNSGLPRMPDNFHPADPMNPYADYTVQQMYDFLNGYQLTRDPGEEFEYSNLGVGLLGHILARIVGQSYERMERERVWQPLGMTHTAITFTPWMKAHLALGHSASGEVVPNWDLPTLAGAGAIRSTTNDMLKFASANLHPERGPLEKAMAFAHQRRASAGAMASASTGSSWARDATPSSGTTVAPAAIGASSASLLRQRPPWWCSPTPGAPAPTTSASTSSIRRSLSPRHRPQRRRAPRSTFPQPPCSDTRVSTS